MEEKTITYSGKRKRSASKEYAIPIDDSVEKIIVTVSTQNIGPTISLKDPLGSSVSSGKTNFPHGALYEINNPIPGGWKLLISGAGKQTYLVKGSSKTNFDFDFFFVMIPSHGTNKKPIPISHPLIGECSFRFSRFFSYARCSTFRQNSSPILIQ